MKFKIITLSLILSTAVIVSACSPSKTTEEYIKQASIHVKNDEINEAIISLKRAIQEQPKKIAPRNALANIYLTNGMGADAEKEFLRVVQLSGELNNAIPGILKAYELQGKSDELIKVLDNLSELTPENKIAAYVYSSIGFIAKGDVVSANVSLESALEFSNESIYQDLGRAYIELNKQNTAVATNIVENLIVNHPSFTEANFLLAQLKFIAEDYQQAIVLFKEYKKSQINDLRVNFLLADALIRTKRYEEAEQETAAILQKHPKHPLANQIKGIVRFNLADYKQAETHLTHALQNGLDSTGSRLMLGISAFHLEKYETSYSYLKSIRDKLNKEHPALKLLVSMQLLLGYTSEANVELTDLSTLDEYDADLLTMTSIELLKLGRKEEARTLLQKSISVKKFDPLLISKQAALKLKLNEPEPLKDLEMALGKVPDHSQANIIYISGLFAKGELQEALKAAKKWQGLKQKSVISNLMLASIYRKLDDRTNALKYYTKVVALDPKHISLNLYQSELAEQKQDLLKAITFLDKILIDHPADIAILAKHLQLSAKVNAIGNSVSLIANAYKQKSKDPYFTLLYAQSLFANKDYQPVIQLLSKVSPNEGNTYSLEYWTLLGESYLHMQKMDEATQLFTLWTKIEPDNEKSWMALALLLDSTNKDGADNVAEEGLKNITESYALKVLTADLLLKKKKNVKAEAVLSKFTKEQQTSFWYKGLKGRLLLTKKEYKNALNYLIPTYNKRPKPKTAAYIMAAYFDLKQIDNGISFMEKHLETYVNDFSSQMLLATTLMELNKDVSIKHYSSLLKKQPKNVIAMNNLSWLLYEQGQYQRSEKIIDVALKLVPQSPNILDTAGMIKIKLGKKDEGVELLKQAKELAPKNVEIRNHYLNAIKSNS